ncbi:hypothetical protein AGOR_G00214240 [Albula goreensis]|uniref:Glutaminase EF-hand domain-containing protein n=1 Tax=Albula goreensis TaxID=1534307 RepID=A0A8T3CNR2_9TELE|nr:hypothetical protein AGOR_G00214240 [Albula goreensis]
MLQFRAPTVLKELFQSSLKRSLTGIAKIKTSSTEFYGFRSGCHDVRVLSKLRTFHAGEYRPSLYPSTEVRSFCTKTEGAVAATEQTKKDEISKEALAEKRRKAGILPSLEDLLFYTIAEGQEKIPAHKFVTALKATGLRTGDPRLRECMEMLKVTLKSTTDGVMLDRHQKVSTQQN